MKSSRKWLAHAPAAFVASLAPGCRVLDAGSGDRCGEGLFAPPSRQSADCERVDKPDDFHRHLQFGQDIPEISNTTAKRALK